MLPVLLGLAASRPASAAEPAALACVEAHAEGQRAEQRGELRTARTRYAQCTSFDCPAAIRRDCDAWRERVEEALPTLIVRVRTASDVTVAPRSSVWVDDTAVPPTRTGLPVEVDPGPHRVRVEAEGYRPVEQSLVIAAAEKGRVVEVQLTKAGAPPASAATTERSPEGARPLPWPWILGGVGVVGVSLFTIVGLDARARYDTYERNCAPRCNPDDVDGLRERYVVADVALAVGGTALVAGAVWLITRALSRPR